MFNSLDTNFDKIENNLAELIGSFWNSAKDGNSVLTCEDIRNDNKLIYGVYKVMEPCVLKMNFEEALSLIYKKGLKIPKPESITRTAKKLDIRFDPHPSHCNVSNLVHEVFSENPEFFEKLSVGDFLIGIFKKIEPEVKNATFGEVLLTADWPSIDTLIRAGRGYRKGE